MTFKKKSETLAAAVASVANTNPNPVKVDLTPEVSQIQETESTQKALKVSSIPAQTAIDAIEYISKRNLQIEKVDANAHGGITFFFKDPVAGTVVPFSFNRLGIVDLLRFGLEAIANNR